MWRVHPSRTAVIAKASTRTKGYHKYIKVGVQVQREYFINPVDMRLVDFTVDATEKLCQMQMLNSGENECFFKRLNILFMWPTRFCLFIFYKYHISEVDNLPRVAAL